MSAPKRASRAPATTVWPDVGAETAQIGRTLAAVAGEGLPPELASFWLHLAALKSIHLRADVDIWTSSGEGYQHAAASNGAATFEYWEMAGRYRISARVPLDSGLSQFSDIAWDGLHRYLYMRDTGTLTIGSRDMRMSPAPLRNPLFLTASFLGVGVYDDEACPLCELRLSDLRATQPGATADGARASATGTVTLHSPTRSGVSYRIEHWGKFRGTAGVIDQLEADGTVVARVKLKNFNPVAEESGLLIPWTVVYEIREKGKGPQLIFTYRLELLDVNKKIDEGVFRIPIEPSMHVWDEDEGMLIQPMM